MTFLNFVNCALLTFAPSFILYKATNLSEFGALLLSTYAGLAYIASEAAKLILLATFLPTTESLDFDLVQHLLRGVAGVADIVAIYFILNLRGMGGGDIRILGVGLGWGTAESLVTRLAPLWIGARQMEFQWDYVFTGINANFSLLRSVAFAALVWLWSWNRHKRERREENAASSSDSLVTLLLGLCLFFPVLTSYLEQGIGVEKGYVLLLQGCFTVGLAFIVKSLYFAAKPEPGTKKRD